MKWVWIPVLSLVGISLITFRVLSVHPRYEGSPVFGKYVDPAVPPRLSEQDLIARGRDLYMTLCMTCHGKHADGYPVTPEGLITFAGESIWARDFTGKTHKEGKVVFKYTWKGYYGEFATDEELAYLIRHGVPGTPMPAFEHLSDEDIQALIAYIKSLHPGWKEFQPYPIPRVEVPADLHSEARIQRGRVLFQQKCVACHNDQEAGKDPVPQPLAWYVPGTDSFQQVLARDFRKDVLRFSHPVEIYRTIRVGIGGTTMNPDLWKELPDSAIWDLVAYVLYLSSQSSESRERMAFRQQP